METVTIKLGKPIFKGSVRLTNNVGRAVITEIIYRSSLVNIDLAQMPSGLYFVEITDGNYRHTQKLIVH